MLQVLEAIARNQPVGVSALARSLHADKSAVQRAIITLAQSGWIGIAPGTPTRWELTAHIFSVAYMGQNNNDWHKRARLALEVLRNATGETALLTVPEARHFVVVDAVESRRVLRTSAAIGTIAPPRESATGRAIMPYMDAGRVEEMLGGPPDAELLEAFADTRRCGYAVSVDIFVEGVASIAAPIFEAGSRPVAAVVVTAPSDRVTAENRARIGEFVAATALSLSRSSA